MGTSVPVIHSWCGLLSMTGEEQDALDTSNEVRCLEVAEQANLLFTGLISGVVLVFPLNSRQDVMCIPPPEARKAVNCMALSKDEGHLAIAYDSTVLVLDISPGDPCPVIDGPVYTFYTQLPDTIASVAVLADYRVIYGMINGDLFLYECVNSKVFPLEAHGSRVTCVEVSHKEQLAVSGSEEALLCLWDLQVCKWKFEMSYTVGSLPQHVHILALENDAGHHVLRVHHMWPAGVVPSMSQVREVLTSRGES